MAEATSLEDLTVVDANSNSIGLSSTNPGDHEMVTDDELYIAKGKVDLLPDNVKRKIKELDASYAEGDLTEKGYTKKLRLLLSPHLHKLQLAKACQEEELYEPDINSLPKFVIEQLEDIERELEEEEITPKGYKRKREKLLAPFMLKEPPISSLPKGIQNDLNELAKEFEDGDLTEKGFKKRRAKILNPYLIKANTWSSVVNVLPGRSNVVTVFVPSKDKQKVLSDNPVGLQIINGNEKLFKCQICNEVFKQAQSFSGHCRLHRSAKSKGYKCTVCKAAYTTRSHLKFHMYKHTGNYPYNCEYCSKGFAGRSQYRYHVLRHSGQSPYICKDCGGRFWKKRNLEVHCSKHRCDDAPAGLQKCAHCLAMFEELEDLQAHMYEHDDEEEASKSGRATMVQKSSSKGSGLDEVVESEQSEEDDDGEDGEMINNGNEEETCSMLSTEIVTVSTS